jgi:ComF family protein
VNAAALVDLLFPPQCGGCARAGSGLCERCAPASARIVRQLPTLQVDAVGVYRDDLRRAVLALKSGRRDVARSCALRLAAFVPAGSVLVPVPTTALRRRERGFDGCVLMAQLAAQATGSQSRPELRQLRGDRQRGRSREERLAAHGRFAWRGEALDGMEIVLLDDVVTTGSTLEDCAHAVRAAGGRVRRAVAIALTP